MALIVSCNHVAPDWRLENVEFAEVAKGEYGQYRVGFHGVESDRRYYAIAPRFGCGRDRATPKQAIEDLLLASAVTSIRIVEKEA